jgi:hypothetical protein
LISARKAIHISQFGTQDCDGFRSKFLDLLQALHAWIIGDLLLDFGFQASQILAGVRQLIAEDL